MSAIFSCREASRLASTAVDRPLPIAKRLQLGMHLAMCSACRAYRRQIRSLDRLLRGRAAHEAEDQEIRLDAEARKRISEALRRRL